MGYSKNKEIEFIDWLCGKEGAHFPYFREDEMPEIPMPVNYENVKKQITTEKSVQQTDLTDGREINQK